MLDVEVLGVEVIGVQVLGVEVIGVEVLMADSDVLDIVAKVLLVDSAVTVEMQNRLILP